MKLTRAQAIELVGEGPVREVERLESHRGVEIRRQVMTRIDVAVKIMSPVAICNAPDCGACWKQEAAGGQA